MSPTKNRGSPVDFDFIVRSCNQDLDHSTFEDALYYLEERGKILRTDQSWASVNYFKRKWFQGLREVEVSRELYRILRRESFKRGLMIIPFVEDLLI